MGKGWTEERRQTQAARCKKNKPWQNATGPKTEAGKSRSCMNAYKHGGDTHLKALYKTLLKHNADFVKLALEIKNIELIKREQKQTRMPRPLQKSDKTN